VKFETEAEGTENEPLNVDDMLHDEIYGPDSVVLNTIFRNRNQAIESLEPGIFINDTVMTYVMKSLAKNHPSPKFKHLDTFLHGQLLLDESDGKNLKSRDRLRVIFKKLFQDNVTARGGKFPYVLFPINPNDFHWSLIVLDIEKRTIRHYCSLGHNLSSYTKSFSMMSQMTSVIDEFMLKYKKSSWKVVDNKNAPLQTDGYNCGIYVYGCEVLIHWSWIKNRQHIGK
jgi:Ulp1 family protease